MKTKKVKDVVAEHPEYSHLIHAVVRQSGGTICFESYTDSSCGIQGGYPGWTYYSDTVTFAERKQNRKQIIQLLEEDVESFGEKDIITMVSNFGYFNNNRNKKSTMDKDDKRDMYRYLAEVKCKDPIIPNLMAWYAAETVARWFFED